MTVDPFRFLGLAFAAADLLFEVSPDMAITFAAGAGKALAGKTDADMIGQPWRALFAEDDALVAEALITGLADGERRGPSDLRLGVDNEQAPRFAALSVFRLPQNQGRISCVLALRRRGVGDAPIGGGLRSRMEFENIARTLLDAVRHGGPELELDLVEFNGLEKQRKSMTPQEASQLDRRIAGALRAEAHGDAAANLGDQRFALLRRAGETPDALARRLRRVLGDALDPQTNTAPIDPLSSANRTMRAMRFALDNFVSNGLETPSASLSEILGQSMQKTMADAGAFGALVKARQFKLVFQPVVSLKDGSVHHHETLVRFDAERSPFALIRMAEELDLIEDLDRAVTETVVKRLRAKPGVGQPLAVNVSGRTIVSGGFIDAVSRLARGGDLAGRLMFEVTESAAIDDLSLAQRHIQALQTMGFQVCLDDFGSGAASYAYLQQLRVDVVKIDGSCVREMTSSGRDDAMIRHLVQLCRDLKASTVAEMVETAAIADQLARAGVDYAQGWLYGQPSAEPMALARPTGPVAARRRGSVEQWG